MWLDISLVRVQEVREKVDLTKYRRAGTGQGADRSAAAGGGHVGEGQHG